ncbi:flagellar hook-associated protein FlgL [Myxococcota bacterium]|nr:flagellar hook-associated protein FlgL [Myxococcota bacterium]MBU1429382.1 flagellar hook-associated protein FlgL [Myxococcota bacterium]MBU1899243.1 flagellar hook-associated protein FlgL [Myxococcota bacterium]
MRLTERIRYQRPAQQIERLRNRAERANEQLVSGARVLRPSDDPGATLRIRALERRYARLEQHERGADVAEARLLRSDASLSEAHDTLGRVHELTIQGLNASLSPQDAENIALEIEGLRDHLLSLANTRVEGRALFGGDGAATPYDAALGFQGDTGALRLEVGEGLRLEASLPGGAAFGDGTPATVDLFANLNDLAAAIRGRLEGPMQDAFEVLEAGQEQLNTARGRLGIALETLGQARAVNEALRARLPSEISDLKDADFTAVVADLSLTDNALQATLATSSRLMSGATLLDFLR